MNPSLSVAPDSDPTEAERETDADAPIDAKSRASE